MSSLSIKQKVLIHLYRFRNVSEKEMFNLPWEMTQDGVATSLMISRAHSCQELKILMDKGLVWERLAHVKGGKTKRKIYMLTSSGLDEYERIKPMAGKDELLSDIINNSDDTRGESIISKNRITDSLGCICVLRTPVPKEIFPVGSIPLIRVDEDGMSIIDSRSKDSVLRLANENQMKKWHSMAADLWLDHWEELDDRITSIHERIHHLVIAGRNIDACRLISTNVFDLILTCNEDLHDSLLRLDEIPERFMIDVLRVRMEADKESDDLDDMRSTIDKMSAFDPVLSKMYLSDYASCKGFDDEALMILSELDDIPMVRIRMAKILIGSRRLDEAREILSALRIADPANGTEIGVERFVLMARLEKMEGHDDDAYSLLMKAMASVNEKGRRRIELALRSMDLRM